MTMNWRRRLVPYLFISPFFIGYAVFFVYPILWAFYLSFFQQKGVISTPKFVGLDNYVDLLSDDLFMRALFNTSYYALGSILLIVPAALGLALVLVIRNLGLREFFRFFFFTPNITAGVVVAIIFRLVYEQDYGLFNNYLLAPLGVAQRTLAAGCHGHYAGHYSDGAVALHGHQRALLYGWPTEHSPRSARSRDHRRGQSLAGLSLYHASAVAPGA